ncbi:dTMP kinase [Betaproteobacteria bacterium]|nr:dTMP kinase [Betaproteobacteria bacterium]
MGKLLVFEGIDGSGKSTQIQMLSNFLKSQKQKVFVTREPGGTEFGEKCRKLFLTQNLDGLTEAYLAFASRNEHILQKIKPALKLGHWVLCDRFSDSTIAYQGYGRGVEIQYLREMATNMEKQLSELRIVYVHTSLETCLKRIKNRGGVKNKFDNSSRIFYEKVIYGYSNIVKERGNNIIQVDGDDEIEKVFKKILQSVPELERFKTKYNHSGNI